MMWCNFRRAANVSVPAPFDDHSSPYWWYDRIAEMAHGLAANGVTDILFPAPRKTNAGCYKGADGYGCWWEYDIGSVNTPQFGGQPTRFGTAEKLRRAIAICRANGISAHVDIVDHQRMGGRNGVYRYPGADGRANTGRFPKDPGCFSPSGPNDKIPPYVHVDPVPDQADNFPFGNPLAPVNSDPKGYVWNGLIEAGDWLFRTLDLQGARLDDMKGMNAGFCKAYMNSKAMAGKFFFGEYASGNPDDLNWWIGQVDGRASAIDFGFHYNRAQKMCNDAGGSGFSMSALDNRNNALMGTNPMKAVTFVESLDSDTNGFATIVDNKTLAYALMLASEGFPMIYIRDYLKEPDCYGLKRYIDNLMWCRHFLANGPTVTRHAESKVFVFERTGSPGLLCALSNDVWNPNWNTVTVQTNFGPNVQIHDYSGSNATDYWTDSNGAVTIAIPPGANGFGYGMWSRAGLSRSIEIQSHSCTQEFMGYSNPNEMRDLDIPSAKNGTIEVGVVWAAKGKPMHVSLTADRTGWTSMSTCVFQAVGPDGAPVLGGTLGPAGGSAQATGTVDHTGYQRLQITSAGLPAIGSPFTMKVNYTAPQTITKDEF